MNRLDKKTLCLIEDDPIMGESLVQRLSLEGLDCDWYQDGQSALDALTRKSFVALISDIRLPDIDGEELFNTMHAQDVAPPPTLFVTGHGSIDQAVRLLKLGALDYITKPFDIEKLIEKIREISPVLFLDDDLRSLEPFLGTSTVMRRVQKMLEVVGVHGIPILITGESGVGKEYAAQFVHSRYDETGCLPFVAVNCAAVPESLQEAELFGHEKGAFTGAIRAHQGLFEQADGGTLFLDEVAEMSAGMQAKLLRVLQDGLIRRIGGKDDIRVNVRVMCATNRDLQKAVNDGTFRKDLFYRINLAHVNVPPLRERREDIRWFAQMFLDEFADKYNKARTLSTAAEQYLLQQSWEGNVRELRHVLEKACIFSPQPELAPSDFSATNIEGSCDEDSDKIEGLRTHLERCERLYLKRVLEENDWQISATATILGISRKNLWEKMRKYGLSQ